MSQRSLKTYRPTRRPAPKKPFSILPENKRERAQFMSGIVIAGGSFLIYLVVSFAIVYAVRVIP